MRDAKGRRPLTFYLLAAFFALYVVFLYGPTATITVLSFQGPNGGLTFPMNGVSTHWFTALAGQQMVGDFWSAFRRSISLAFIVMLLAMTIGTMVGMAYRSRFRGSNALFYLTIASLIVPSILVSLGVGVLFDRLGWEPNWYSSALGAQLTWVLPFAFLIMLAVFSRFNRSYEEAARDLGAGEFVTFREVILPLILPSLIGVGLLGFTMSYDEFARTLMAVGGQNTLPLEIYGMTTNVTTPVLYALGTTTTAFSLAIIVVFLIVALRMQRRAERLRREGLRQEAV